MNVEIMPSNGFQYPVCCTICKCACCLLQMVLPYKHKSASYARQLEMREFLLLCHKNFVRVQIGSKVKCVPIVNHAFKQRNLLQLITFCDIK